MCFWLIKSLFTYPVEWRISFWKIAFIDKHSGFAIFKRGTKKEDKRWVRKKSVLKNAECPTIALSLTGFEKCPFLRFLCVSWFWRPLLRQCTIWRTKFVLTNVKKKAGAFHPRSIYVQTAKVSIPNAEEFYWILPFWRLISCIRKCNRHSICDCWFKIWCYLWLFLVHPLLLLSIFLTNFLLLVQLEFPIKGTQIHSFHSSNWEAQFST